MSRCLVGYTGFVGSNLLQYYKFDYLYNSKNFKEAMNKEFDEVYFCGVPAVKWYANKNPQEDLLIINNLIDILKTIKTDKIYLISTIDVYEDPISKKDESYDCNYTINHTYGKNRYIFEQFIQSHFQNHYIIRLPALFGKGLKKNIIYDLLNNNALCNIPVYSSLQWYDLNWLKDDIELIIKNNIRVCNLFTEPLDTIKILNLFENDVDNYNNTNRLNYNITTQYSNIFNSSITGYIRDKKTVENSIKDFIIFYRKNRSNLVVSNICIKSISQLQFASILKLYGITNVQIAPTTITNWENFNNIDLSVYTNNNINIYSFQSITYTLNNMNIFNEKSELLYNHLTNVIDVAIKNKVKILVFGCPKNRYILDTNIDNDKTFIDFFRNIGKYCENKDIKICIENNSKKYNCNYLNSINDVGNIVRKINHNNIKMMVDLGNCIMENDDMECIYNFSDIIYNIDVSQENMSNFCNPNSANYIFKNILNNIKYNKNINLEMLLEPNNELVQLTESLYNFINMY
jgi:hypothetical protein